MDELLQTPSAADALGGHLTRGGDRKDDLLLKGQVKALRTSASSQGSAAWISRWKRRGLPASARSSGTPTAPASSSDGGRLFPVGEMSRGSALLPTPNATPYGYNQQDSPNAVKRPGLWTYFSEGSPANPPPPPADGREPPMIAGSGPSSPVSLASYDPALSSWRTYQGSLLSTEDERFPRSWERWPTSGMTRRGRAYALPMSARPTDGSGSSSLPTPTGRDHKGRNQRDDASCLTGALDELLEVQEGDPKHRLETRIEVLRRSHGDPTTPRSDDGSEP